MSARKPSRTDDLARLTGPMVTRDDRRQAAVFGMRPAEVARLRAREEASVASRPRGPRREVTHGAYDRLVLVAQLTQRLMPLLEEAGAAHREPRAFIQLREALADLSAEDAAMFGQRAAVGELLSILRDTDG